VIFRVALTADTHADENHRLAEHDRVLEFIADDAAARRCDLMLHAGDLFERAKSTAIERASVATWVRRVTEEMPLVAIAGNHDGELDVAWLGRLRTQKPIRALTRPDTIAIGGALVAGLPWPRKANLLAALGRPVSHEESGAIAQDCLRNVVRGLGAGLEGWDGPRILLAHVMIDGAQTDHSQPIVGADMAVSLTDLALARADFYACGHVHAGQRWEINGAPCLYPSAPRHCNFGEPGSKAYVVATFDEAGGEWRCVDVESVPTPCAAMHLVEDEWGTDSGSPDHYTWIVGLHGEPYNEDDYRGSDVRFRYRVDSDQRDAARARLPEIRQYFDKRGVARLKVEEIVRPTLRARAPEIAKATTLEDQLGALWATKRPDLGDERRARLIAKLGEVRT
jgi:DNA repair exonuclease SbcCD nuclease subunit